MPCGKLPACSCLDPPGRGLYRLAGRRSIRFNISNGRECDLDLLGKFGGPIRHQAAHLSQFFVDLLATNLTQATGERYLFTLVKICNLSEPDQYSARIGVPEASE